MTTQDSRPLLEEPTDQTPPDITATDTTTWRSSVLRLTERFGLVILLVAVAVYFTLNPATSATFPTTSNARNIVANESVLILVALAALVPLVAHRFDLSVGAIVALTSIAAAKATTSMDLPILVSVVLAVVIGAIVGLANGVLIAYFRANSLVITLGMATLLGGVASAWSGHQTIVGVPTELTSFGNGLWLGVPRPVFLVVVVVLGVSFLLGLTIFGRRLLSVGVNESAAHLVGLPVQRTVTLAFVASGALAGLAGALLLARTGSAASGVGVGYLLPALAAIFLGSTTIRPGRYTVAGTLVGVFFVAISINGLTLAGAADWVEPAFNGGAVIVAVAVSSLLTHRRLTGASR
ncbi:ABC transporter permease [Nocardioides carbamazepini]|uniref:ABC transporter permease n=1 Tax=Nocardioides carbamazepini TaxID=2854259 RepID=UPI002149D428|nr:ABC transporter permease [Nocardioides carbamazepini]MCR1781916.1 ABC transporter permease [Nocardioides carbamazepini]